MEACEKERLTSLPLAGALDFHFVLGPETYIVGPDLQVPGSPQDLSPQPEADCVEGSIQYSSS